MFAFWVFVMSFDSQVEEPQKMLVKVGKQFKKNNIAVDVVNFGAENAENEKRGEAGGFRKCSEQQ